MLKKLFLFGLIILISVSVTGCRNYQNEYDNTNYSTTNTQNSNQNQPAEQIEIVHFHGTNQCWSCIIVGEYALKTIKEKFSEEYENGKIVFKEINGDLPENAEIVNKYKARGSSLFINSIIDGKDNIKEDVDVWRQISNESKFSQYFENKLNSILGK